MAAQSYLVPSALHDDAKRARKTKKLLAGACSGMISALAFQPLDVLRTHQQGAFGSLSSPSTTPQLPLSQQLRSMWRGTAPTLIRVAGGAGLYFATLDHCMAMTPPTAINTFLAGAFARTFAGGVMSPFTIIKARMEWQSTSTTTIRQILHQVVQQEGVRGLYRGMIPTLVRDVPFSGLYVLLYTRMKSFLETKCPSAPLYSLHFGSGVVAGILATTVVHPADVVKTRMQLTITTQAPDGRLLQQTNCMTLRQTIAKILREEGAKGFAKGILPRVIKRTLSTAVTWTIYEQLSLR